MRLLIVVQLSHTSIVLRKFKLLPHTYHRTSYDMSTYLYHLAKGQDPRVLHSPAHSDTESACHVVSWSWSKKLLLFLQPYLKSGPRFTVKYVGEMGIKLLKVTIVRPIFN